MVPAPFTSLALTLPPSVVIWMVPNSPVPNRSPPPVSSRRSPDRSLAFTLPPSADSVTPLEKPDAAISPPLLHRVTAVFVGTSRVPFIPQSVLIPLQLMSMLAPVDVMVSPMAGRTRPYWTVPVSRAVLPPGASRSVTFPALTFTAT